MMKLSTLATFSLSVLMVSALPLVRKTQDDTAVLNLALTLEHLENAFYEKALGEFDEEAFQNAGLPPWVRGRYIQIAANEKAHETLLTQILGKDATQPCTYSFPFNDPKSFVALSAALEGGGASAYTGALSKLTDETHVTTAGAILSTEARQQGWINSAVLKANPWSTAFETPLDASQIVTIASAFIDSCPSTNPPLPKAFPSLSINATSIAPGSTVTVSFTPGTTLPAQTFLGFLTGLDVRFAPITDGKATLPALNGTVYAVVNSNNQTVTDDSIVAGPTILIFPFDSQGELILGT